MLVSSRSCLLCSLACKLCSFFNLLQMITARIIKRPSVLKYLRILPSFALLLWLWTLLVNLNKITVWIVFSQLWFGILDFLIDHVVGLKSGNCSGSLRCLHYWLRSWVLSRMLSRFLSTLDVWWASRFVWSFHFWLTNFSAVMRFMSRFYFLFGYFDLRKLISK